ncbi:C-type lectin domain family 4 member M-like isoform X1 [Thunnus albacares]|uniref:C-type lectin domain family 4 member M-like isoform X1 n=1 Tax=Thunnus albacares TaxID=8236 RepID=UPI001CF6FBC3|nr:C-type lectin domain family 4 member M-like isoform X1 [Thunnus albacares]
MMTAAKMENHYTITQETKVGLHYFNCPQNAFAKPSVSVVHFELTSKLSVCSGSMSTIRVGSRSLPMYPLLIMCLGLLNIILLLAAVVIGIYCGKVPEEYAPHQIKAQELFIEVKHLQAMQSEVIKAEEETHKALKKELSNLQALQLQLDRNKTLSDGFQSQIEALQVEKAILQSSTSDILASCGRCLPGWFLLNTSCYFHSKSESSLLKNWPDSRADCIHRGADLVVIDNLEEQVNLSEFLPKLDSRPWWRRRGGVWIGLTDIQTEGTWVWVNNVTQLDRRYWRQREHDNYGTLDDDCAALMNTDSSQEMWYDASCKENKEWLCEMVPNN